jgi:hypothetical protein
MDEGSWVYLATLSMTHMNIAFVDKIIQWSIYVVFDSYLYGHHVPNI